MPRALSLFSETLLLSCVCPINDSEWNFSFVISIWHSVLRNRGTESSPIAVLFREQSKTQARCRHLIILVFIYLGANYLMAVSAFPDFRKNVIRLPTIYLKFEIIFFIFQCFYALLIHIVHSGHLLF